MHPGLVDLLTGTNKITKKAGAERQKRAAAGNVF